VVTFILRVEDNQERQRNEIKKEIKREKKEDRKYGRGKQTKRDARGKEVN
jgi:hypothetical protein